MVIKDGVLNDGICMLAYFHKDSAVSCKEIKKDCDKKDSDKEDCGDWKRLRWLKRIVIIEKYCG